MKRGKDNRSLLIETAKKLFKENGYEASSIRMIYTEAGLSNGTFYHFFNSKHELLAAICDRDADIYDLLSDLDNKAADPAPHILAFYLSYARYWNSLGAELTAEAYRLYDKVFLNKDFSRIEITVVEHLAIFIEAAQEKGKFDRSMSPKEAAEYLFILARGLLYEWALRHGHFDLVEFSRKYLPRIIGSLITQEEPRETQQLDI